VAGLDPATHVVAARIGIDRADNAKQPELEHDPEKCAAVFRKDHAQSIKDLKRDDDST
jgi:hypothetical protein